MEISEIQKKVIKFDEERDWTKFHNPKDMAISLSLEAAELLEIFQWSGTDLHKKSSKALIEEELADIFIFCLLMANCSEVDIEQAVLNKMEINAKKYPISKCFGNTKKYTEL